MSDDSVIAVVAIGCVFGLPLVVAAVSLVTSHLRQVKADEANTALKRDMIERGFSADEIVRVIEAGKPETKEKAEVE